MKAFLFLMMIFSCVSVEAAGASTCEPKKWKLSTFDIELSDKDYLQMVMGFSYGDKVINYIPELKSAQSNMYYETSKAEPYLTFFKAEYKTEKVAKEAHRYLNEQWLGRSSNLYDVQIKGKTVTWFGNNRLDAKCFFRVVKGK